jgi:hypothetical protein
MKRTFAAVFASLAIPALAEMIFASLPVGVTPANAATASQNLAIEVTLGQAPTAVTFAPPGPVNVSDTAEPRTAVAAVQVATNDGQPFTGSLLISFQNATGMVGLSATSIPSNVQIASVNAGDDGPQCVTVAACDKSGVHRVAGTLGMNVSPAPSPSTILPPDRDASANWKMAGMLSTGGIPNRTKVCATVSPKGSGADDTTNIQNAVNACPLGQVVSLSAGTFTIAEGNYVLLNKGVSLRGAGPGSTILTRTGGATLNSYNPGNNPSPMIILGPMRYNNNETATTFTADGAQGAYSVQVASTAGFSVGQIVLLDEASGAGWQPDVISTNYQIWAAPDYRVVWQKHNPVYKYVDDFSANQNPYQAGTAGCWFSNCDRPTNEMHRITAISGDTITFDSPLTISYRVSHQAQLYFYKTPLTQNAGVENLTVQYGDVDNIDFDWCAYCWAQNVENTLWLGAAFGLNNSFRVQLEEVYIHNGIWPVSGGGGYNISIANGSSEALVENSISVLTNKVIVDRSSGAGSVVAYNYMDDGYINGKDTWVEIGLNGSHMVGGHHVLFEGNQSFNVDSDQTHGNSIYHTFFRNWLTGYRKPFTALDGTAINDANGCCGPLRAAGAHAYAYWFSFIGNVLGAPGQMNGWTYNCIGSLNNIPSSCIWELGYMDISPQGYDPQVAATAIQDGNYDYLNNAQKWITTPGGYPLPNSLYLSGKPTFFGSYQWPWVDPTTGTTYTLPAKARYDTGTPFVQP